MSQAGEVKETKAQRSERLKREKNPWETFNEVREFARNGRASVVPEWAGTYFKWWGVYTQGDGIGAVGGKGGEGLASEWFMMRIGIPNGIVVTLRGHRAYDMIDRLVNVVIPRVRDFRGLSVKSFDGHGNYSVGFKDALVFPEINPDSLVNPHGVSVTIVTNAKNNEQGIALLRHMGFPFKKEL